MTTEASIVAGPCADQTLVVWKTDPSTVPACTSWPYTPPCTEFSAFPRSVTDTPRIATRQFAITSHHARVRNLTGQIAVSSPRLRGLCGHGYHARGGALCSGTFSFVSPARVPVT